MVATPLPHSIVVAVMGFRRCIAAAVTECGAMVGRTTPEITCLCIEAGRGDSWPSPLVGTTLSIVFLL